MYKIHIYFCLFILRTRFTIFIKRTCAKFFFPRVYKLSSMCKTKPRDILFYCAAVFPRFKREAMFKEFDIPFQKQKINTRSKRDFLSRSACNFLFVAEYIVSARMRARETYFHRKIPSFIAIPRTPHSHTHTYIQRNNKVPRLSISRYGDLKANLQYN